MCDDRALVPAGRQDERGAALVEYVVLIGLFAVALVAVLPRVAGAVASDVNIILSLIHI